MQGQRVQTWWVGNADHNDVEQKTGVSASPSAQLKHVRSVKGCPPCLPILPPTLSGRGFDLSSLSEAFSDTTACSSLRVSSRLCQKSESVARVRFACCFFMVEQRWFGCFCVLWPWTVIATLRDTPYRLFWVGWCRRVASFENERETS